MRAEMIVLAGCLALAACNPLKEQPKNDALPGTVEFFEQERARCEARGGSFGGDEEAATKVCFITPKDANQACSQASDCEGQCLARSKTCAPVVPLLGCHEVLMDGGLPATICLN